MDLNTEKNKDIKIHKSNLLSKLLNMLSIKEKHELVSAENLEEVENLIESIKNARKEWISANANFEYAVESEIIDYYTYKIKAYQIRYDYLIKKAKEKGVTLEYMGN
ncbi:MAG: YaaL family protein [Bacillota bacterium]